MIDLSLMFVGGLLGSGHFIGMCGAFAVAIGWPAERPVHNLFRQSVYSLGRLSSYVFLGAVAGFAGERLTLSFSTVSLVQCGLSLVAGVVLLATGLVALGLLPSSDRWLSRLSGCSAAKQFRDLMKSRSLANLLIAGMATGFLPCGLVYAFVALALSSGSPLTGMSVMAAFGAGTVPAMVATGLGSSLLSVNARRRLMRVAAFSVMLIGILTITRGVLAFNSSSDTDTVPDCPFCDVDQVSSAGSESETLSGNVPNAAKRQPTSSPSVVE